MVINQLGMGGLELISCISGSLEPSVRGKRFVFYEKRLFMQGERRKAFMRNRSLITVFILLLCEVLALSGCGTMDSDVSVVFKLDDEIYHVSKINAFENELIPAFPEDAVPNDMKFMGWGFSEEQTENLLSDQGFISIGYIKATLGEVEKTVVMYPVFSNDEVVIHDLVVGWYNLPATSGMTDEIADSYEAELFEYLESSGNGGLDVVVRPYEGNVSASCGLVLQDADVDILIGWGGNLTSKGGITPIERSSPVKLGAVDDRYIDLISEKELAKTVFDWTVSNASILAR